MKECDSHEERDKLFNSLKLLEKIPVVEAKLKEFYDARNNLQAMLDKEIRKRIKEFNFIPNDIEEFKKKAYDSTYQQFCERISLLEQFKESLYLGIELIQRDTQSVCRPEKI